MIPVTIITGFLGAGKTTLLNQIIQQHPDKRFAIIENEVGAVNLDSDFILAKDEEIFQITDGCLCCSLRLELNKVLAALLRRRSEFDHLLIETTGIADPSGVAAAFLSDLDVQVHFRLDGVLCVVDCLHIEELLQQKETEAARQISFSDVIVLNKTDLIEPAALDRLQPILRIVNPFARTVKTAFADFATTPLLSLAAFEHKKLERHTQRLEPIFQLQHGNITAQTYEFEQPFDFLKFKQFVQTLLLFQGMRIYRMKGVLYMAETDEKVVFQSVQKQVVFTKGSPWQTDEKRESRLVVIGNGLLRSVFEGRLRGCLSDSKKVIL